VLTLRLSKPVCWEIQIHDVCQPLIFGIFRDPLSDLPTTNHYSLLLTNQAPRFTCWWKLGIPEIFRNCEILRTNPHESLAHHCPEEANNIFVADHFEGIPWWKHRWKIGLEDLSLSRTETTTSQGDTPKMETQHYKWLLQSQKHSPSPFLCLIFEALCSYSGCQGVYNHISSSYIYCLVLGITIAIAIEYLALISGKIVIISK